MSLKVKDLYLEGFAKIHTGMHIDRLYLDFESMPHQTFLFVGDSGSGKSSTLRSIHPFAFNSCTGDETSNSDLIMSGRDGKKVIRYELNSDIIKCSHIYTRKNDGSIQVKSYFSINNEELNPSGLVSTFKELVLKYFRIDESFLTLLSLGNSVRSIVEHTSGERKKLSVKLFTELNVYMTYYKNASAVVKDLKSVLNNVIDKLDKYGNYNKKELKKSIRELTNLIDNLQKELDTILTNEGVLIANRDSLMGDYKIYEESQGKITELLERVELLKRKRKTSKDVEVLGNDKASIKGNLINIELRIESLKSNIESELNFKEMKMTSMKQMEESLHRMEFNINKIELEKLLANIDSELASLTDIELDDNIDYKEKKDQLVKANIYLDELRSMSTDLVSEVELPELIPDMVKRFINDKNFDYKVDIAYKAAIERVNNLKIANHIGDDFDIKKIEYKCDIKDCPYKKFYDDAYKILFSKKNESKEILREEHEKLRTAEQMVIIRRILSKLYTYINSHMDILKYVPREIFDPETFVDKFLSSLDREIYNRDLMGSSVTYMESASRKMELLVLRESTTNQLNGINNTKELYDSMTRDLELIKHTISDVDAVITDHQTNLEFNNTKLIEYTKDLSNIDIEITLARELEDVRNTIRETQSNLSKLEQLKISHDNLERKIKLIKDEEDSKRSDLNNYRENLNLLKNKLSIIESLEREKIQLAERYNEAVMIKDAVSPSKGIPVEFIDDVIRNQMIDSINDLMHVAYPDITLLKDPDHLIINDKEFTIPYKKNGVIIDDISEASDGERAMLSLAFSLVLIRLVSRVYNIMLLDEMDTSLDKYGRSKYIDIIEQYMDTINASQIFLISHNSMFDMYGVNVLQTSDGVSSGNNITYVFKQNFTPREYIE